MWGTLEVGGRSVGGRGGGVVSGREQHTGRQALGAGHTQEIQMFLSLKEAKLNPQPASTPFAGWAH